MSIESIGEYLAEHIEMCHVKILILLRYLGNFIPIEYTGDDHCHNGSSIGSVVCLHLGVDAAHPGFCTFPYVSWYGSDANLC